MHRTEPVFVESASTISTTPCCVDSVVLSARNDNASATVYDAAAAGAALTSRVLVLNATGGRSTSFCPALPVQLSTGLFVSMSSQSQLTVALRRKV